MPWFFLQRLLEMLLCVALYDKFKVCKTVYDILPTFLAMSQLEQVGCVTIVVVIFASIGQTLKAANTTRSQKKNDDEGEHGV